MIINCPLCNADGKVLAGSNCGTCAHGKINLDAWPELIRGCQAAIAYLVDPPSIYPENRKAAKDIIESALRKAGAK